VVREVTIGEEDEFARQLERTEISKQEKRETGRIARK
jgi:hypothetical protein